jgi:hypothetical protein
MQQLASVSQNFAEKRMNKAIASVLEGAHVDSVNGTK